MLLLGLGLGYAIFASVVWPAIPAVVDREQLGTAYGLTTSLQNFGLFVLPLLVSVVLEASQDGAPTIDPNPYAGVELFFALLASCGVVAGLVLNADRVVRNVLNTPGGSLAKGWTPAPSPVSTRRPPLVADVTSSQQQASMQAGSGPSSSLRVAC